MPGYNDYLAHYGVLGMKWGVHRARKNQQKAAKARAKGDTAKANKYSAKAKAIEQKHTDRTTKATYNRVKNTSTAKLLGESLVLGTYGALTYERARASGASRGESVVSGLLARTLDVATGGIASIALPRAQAASKREARGE